MRDRIKELRRVKAAELRPNPRNWRLHPPAQRGALQAVLEEVGFAGALLARELESGELELIDGHLRAEIDPDADVPVLVLDVDEREANKILATYDPLGGLAETDGELLASLVGEVETEREALATLLDELVQRSRFRDPAAPPVAFGEVLHVIVECRD